MMNCISHCYLKKIVFLLVVLFLCPSLSKSQVRENDFALWSWFQVEKKFQKKQYVEFQYQIRFNENVSQFNRSNIYFIYGRNVRKNLNVEFLYQLNTNHKNDQHTLFVGFTYKQSMSYRSYLSFRTAVQNTHNYFTGDYKIDEPYNEWRNRLRFVYRISSPFQVSLSVEPYLLFKPTANPYFSRIRFVAQTTYKFNKYQNLSLFYLVQPDLVTTSTPKTNYVLGITYHLTLPNSLNGFKKLLHLKSKEEDESDDTEPFKNSGI